MISLDAGTVLLQWATGGLLFLWVTTRRRQVGLGYGWLLRASYAVIAAGGVAAGQALGPVPVRDGAAVVCALAATAALVVSVVWRRAGVRGQREEEARKASRVAAMTGGTEPSTAAPAMAPAPAAAGLAADRNSDTDVPAGTVTASETAGPVREFPPVLDLIAPVAGLIGLVAGGLAAGGPPVLAVTRTILGALFLGAVSDAMLLGHWYLVQPGLGRAPLLELNRWLAIIWPFEVAALLWPVGMVSVFTGRIDDGYGGILGWFWAACAITTIVLCGVTKAALKERAYSAVMAATGLLYLAILTAFGTDLVARAVLAG